MTFGFGRRSKGPETNPKLREGLASQPRREQVGALGPSNPDKQILIARRDLRAAKAMENEIASKQQAADLLKKIQREESIDLDTITPPEGPFEVEHDISQRAA